MAGVSKKQIKPAVDKYLQPLKISTAAELHKQTGVPETTCRRLMYEASTDMTLSNAIAFCELFNISAQELFKALSDEQNLSRHSTIGGGILSACSLNNS